MNLIDESFEPRKKDNSKKIARIILIIIALLVIAIIAIGYKDIFRVKQDDIETIDETHIRTDK